MAAPTAETHPTIIDWAKRLDPDGQIDGIVELQSQTNEINEDAVVLESNLPTGHLTTVRTDIPAGTWRMLYQGIKPSKSKTQQVTEGIGMLEDYGEVDKALADLNGNTAAWRMSEERPTIDGMGQNETRTLFYGDTRVYPARYMGLSPRYDSIGDPNKTGVSYGDHCINMGGTTASVQTSMWLIVWGPETVFKIFPKGSIAGMKVQNLGEQTIYTADGGQFQGYRNHYRQDSGLVVRDWRYIIRMANIQQGWGPDDFDYLKMIDAYNTIPSLGMGRAAFYCNRRVKSLIDKKAAEKSNAALSIDMVFGKPQTNFWGIPVRQCDALLDTEAVVS